MRPEYQQQIDYVRMLKENGAQMMAARVKVSGEVPADIGLFGGDTFPAFEFGKRYAKNDLFSYDGKPGYVKQDHTSQSTWIPFSAGTESIYGARPKMKADGTYDYVYNMAAIVGMKVWDNGTLYECTRDINDMLYPPSQVPAHFNVAEADGTGGSDSGADTGTEAEAWVQPSGEHDAYTVGDIVSYNGKLWQSTVNGNTWAPDVYGWTEVTA